MVEVEGKAGLNSRRLSARIAPWDFSRTLASCENHRNGREGSANDDPGLVRESRSMDRIQVAEMLPNAA